MNELNTLILESYSDLVDSRLELLLEGKEKSFPSFVRERRITHLRGEETAGGGRHGPAGS